MPQIQLNEEQMAAVEHPMGEPACLVAGAGSGKTRVLTERVRWLINHGISPRRIVAITFTNKAAGELVDRLDLEDGSFDIPKVSTIHSLALSAIRRSPTGFGLQEKVTPLDDYDRHQMLRRILEREVNVKDRGISVSSWVYTFLDKVGYHRNRGLGFCVEYTDEVHEQALVAHAGYHALEPLDLQIWKAYEEEKKKNSVVDFDDMLHLVVRRLRVDEPYRLALQKMFDHVLMDEAQDTNQVQWELVNYFLSPANHNIYVVGDMSQSIMGFIGSAPYLLKEFSENWRGATPKLYRIAKNHRSLPRIVYLANHIQSKMSECQPAGTMVRVVTHPVIGFRESSVTGWKSGTRPAEFTEVDISLLTTHKVQPWKREPQGYTPGRGKDIQVASRPYRGQMLTIHTSSNLSTRVTPNHHVWVKFNREAIANQYIVYLMYKEGVGFRIGCTKFKRYGTTYVTKGGRSGTSYGLTGRLKEEYADAAWILKVFDTRQEAETWEEIYSARYGIPESVFTCNKAKNNKPQNLIDLIFEELGNCSDGAKRCLTDHGLLLEYPLVSGFGNRDKRLKPWLGYFRTAAANLAPLKGLIDIPVVGICKSTRITEVTNKHYEGIVYSLDVEKYHTYVADGLVVGNSIPLKMQVFRGDAENKGTIELTRASLPLDIALIIAGEIHKDNQRKKGHIPYKDNCILVRSARQIMDIENALVRYRIPYQVRGGKGLLQTEEIRDVLSYLRLVTNPKDFTALVRAVGVPKRGVGDVALEKIRKVAHEKHNGDLIMGASSVDKLGLFVQQLQSIQQYREFPVQALEQILLHMDYKNYISQKYKKEADKVKSKLENIDRFKELVRALTEDQKMTTDDVVFQLTLDRAREDDKDGMVTVSTIHSAKGLEWKRVYVFGVVEGLLPHRFCQTPIEIQEEMRLFYVAVTRARDNLTLCVHAMEQNEGNTRRVAPSRFLIDLGIISE